MSNYNIAQESIVLKTYGVKTNLKTWGLVLFLALGIHFLGFRGVSANHGSYPYADNFYSYTNCSWNQSATNPLRVAQSTAYPFPGDSTAPDNGAPQSFRRRINDATARWSAAYSNASVPKTLKKVGDGATNEILFQYTNPGGGNLAATYYRRTQDSQVGGADRCVLRGSGKHTLLKIQIRVQPRNDWFTQDDPYRAAWEGCGSNFNGYTCSKRHDFGGMVMHEIGHGLGLKHTEDSATGLGCPQTNKAGTPAQPTMCALQTEHRTEKRTLEFWDADTLHKHVDKNR